MPLEFNSLRRSIRKVALSSKSSPCSCKVEYPAAVRVESDVVYRDFLEFYYPEVTCMSGADCA